MRKGAAKLTAPCSVNYLFFVRCKMKLRVSSNKKVRLLKKEIEAAIIITSLTQQLFWSRLNWTAAGPQVMRTWNELRTKTKCHFF